ncbi:Hydroxyethylthiazole kinase [Microthyrium microscopicum]|uniref:Hydroxyethylthiazole kinase n=1 Tax=Microthyrium microscopicum TaxID=703497 RepID=A0A6A6UN49_9PEZI|nr:Hydroxyethylthiazole kinase [Microthyrium microscopicum]
MAVDYTLYLVTDSTPEILGDRCLADVVESGIKGGVTVVQYRNKTADTAELVREASTLHEITRRHGVPLIINDRIDVAIAIGAEGVHVGQDDMDLQAVQRILRTSLPNAIIGVSTSSVEEALTAARNGATYLGIGTVFATSTKKDTKSIIGAIGVQKILTELRSNSLNTPCVCIGGVNASNVQQILRQSRHDDVALDGVAVVSAIMAAPNPSEASQNLRNLIAALPAISRTQSLGLMQITNLSFVPDYIAAVVQRKPLCHNMINTVVQTMAANMAIAIGGSPIMSGNGAEAADLAKLGGSLVINMGTVTPDSLDQYVKAISAYNAAGNPVLLDPVGCGATELRKEALQTVLTAGLFDVIKGNEGEIATIAGTSAQQHGVDSAPSNLTLRQKAIMVEEVAKRCGGCVVVMSGAVDIVSDGYQTVFVRNGHEYMGLVTGSGCCLGTVIAAFLAVHRENKLLATLAALLLYEIAAEQATTKEAIRGPGSFLPAWIDTLYQIAQSPESDQSWIKGGKVEVFQHSR